MRIEILDKVYDGACELRFDEENRKNVVYRINKPINEVLNREDLVAIKNCCYLVLSVWNIRDRGEDAFDFEFCANLKEFGPNDDECEGITISYDEFDINNLPEIIESM